MPCYIEWTVLVKEGYTGIFHVICAYKAVVLTEEQMEISEAWTKRKGLLTLNCRHILFCNNQWIGNRFGFGKYVWK